MNQNLSGEQFSVQPWVPDERYPDEHAVQAVAGDKQVGHLVWHGAGDFRRGEVAYVWVDEAHRRQGIASHLWQAAKQRDPQIKHSSTMSDDAKAWAATLERGAKH